jgi:hypothetical protein
MAFFIFCGGTPPFPVPPSTLQMQGPSRNAPREKKADDEVDAKEFEIDSTL